MEECLLLRSVKRALKVELYVFIGFISRKIEEMYKEQKVLMTRVSDINVMLYIDNPHFSMMRMESDAPIALIERPTTVNKGTSKKERVKEEVM